MCFSLADYCRLGKRRLVFSTFSSYDDATHVEHVSNECYRWEGEKEGRKEGGREMTSTDDRTQPGNDDRIPPAHTHTQTHTHRRSKKKGDATT